MFHYDPTPLECNHQQISSSKIVQYTFHLPSSITLSHTVSSLLFLFSHSHTPLSLFHFLSSHSPSLSPTLSPIATRPSFLFPYYSLIVPLLPLLLLSLCPSSTPPTLPLSLFISLNYSSLVPLPLTFLFLICLSSCPFVCPPLAHLLFPCPFSTSTFSLPLFRFIFLSLPLS